MKVSYVSFCTTKKFIIDDSQKKGIMIIIVIRERLAAKFKYYSYV